MIPLAVQTVHTAGINWESIAAIVGALVASITYLDFRQTRKQNGIRTEIREAVGNLGQVLDARLESKEKVAQLTERVAKVEGELDNERRNRQVR